MKIKVRIGDQDFAVEVGDLNTRPVLAMVDGESFEVWPESGQQLSDEQMESPATSAPMVVSALKPTAAISRAREILSPLPGVVIGLSVKSGSLVQLGQELCVIEAMKMKNIIRAGRSGRIAEVQVSVGQQVMPRQPLFTFSD